MGATTRSWPSAPPPPSTATLERLAAGPDPVALVVVARRMKARDGLAVLQQAHELLPAAKRVLLEHRGEWTSGEPVVRAMTLGQVDYLLFRPWLPIEQHLYLPVSEFLAAWEKSRDPSTEVIQIVGRRWAARSHNLRDALARVGIPYGFYPDDSPDGQRLLEQAGEDGSRLPGGAVPPRCRHWRRPGRPDQRPAQRPPWACGPPRPPARATS